MRQLSSIVLFAVLCSPIWPAEANRPNIILFVTDDMGADAGCYGNAVIKTPHLDALAKDGIRLTSAFCTTASCCRAAVAAGAITVAVPGTHSRRHDFSGAALVAESLADPRIYERLGISHDVRG